MIDRRMAALASLAGVLTLPGVASAGWGDEVWGVMLWNGPPAPGVPVLPTAGLVTLAFLLWAASRWMWPSHLPATKPEGDSGMELGEPLGLRDEIEQLRKRLGVLEANSLRRRWARLTRARLGLFVAVLGVATASYATVIGMPNTFVNGTIADANEVNANFTVLTNESNDQHWRLNALEMSGFGTVSSVGTGSGLVGGPITTAGTISVAGGGITATHIATDAVGSAELIADSVTASEVATNAIGALEIAPDAVAASEIAADAVGSSEIAANAVGSSELADDAVGASEIAADGVGASEIAANAVGSSELANDAVGMADLDITFVQDSMLLSGGEIESDSLNCPAGYVAIGSTWRQLPVLEHVTQIQNGNPLFVGGSTWQFTFRNPTTVQTDVNYGIWCVRNS